MINLIFKVTTISHPVYWKDGRIPILIGVIGKNLFNF